MLNPISRLAFYDSAPLEGKVPPQMSFMGNGFADYPFLLIDGFLPPETCAALYADALATRRIVPAEVKEANLPHARVDKNLRSTAWLSLDETSQAIYRAAFLEQKPQIERFFNHLLLEGSGLQVLGYGPGDFYGMHADNCSILLDEKGEISGWQPVATQRKITTVLFLNDDFEGGKLTFDFLKDANGQTLMLTPKAGTMVAFPSNPYFAHTVHPVSAGYRVTLVEWHDALRL
ncbi:MAG: 2OG-Fe(II) oxygenase [Campylobacterales bacterium]